MSNSKYLQIIPCFHYVQCATSQQMGAQTRLDTVPQSTQQEEFYASRSTATSANWTMELQSNINDDFSMLWVSSVKMNKINTQTEAKETLVGEGAHAQGSAFHAYNIQNQIQITPQLIKKRPTSPK